LLTARPELETNRRLEMAARRLGVDVVTVDACQLVASLSPVPDLRLGDRSLLAEGATAVLGRVGNWRPETLLAVLEVAVAAELVTPNPPSAIRIGRDHWATVARLASVGLPVPETLVGADPESLAAAAQRQFGLPVVVKQRRSRMGVGVIRCDTGDHLEAVLDTLWRVGDEVVVQRFIPTGGQSARLLVVGDRVVAAATFKARTGEWRSNAARGGTTTPLEPPAAMVELALSAAGTLGLGLCGVDFLMESERGIICEVNPTPGFLALERATGIDVAMAIIGHLVELAGEK